jgi:hypothetical protein
MQRTLIKALVIGVTFLFFIVSNDGITGVKQQQPLRSKALLSLDRIVATKTDVGTNNTIPAGEDFPSVSFSYYYSNLIIFRIFLLFLDSVSIVNSCCNNFYNIRVKITLVRVGCTINN